MRGRLVLVRRVTGHSCANIACRPVAFIRRSYGAGQIVPERDDTTTKEYISALWLRRKS